MPNQGQPTIGPGATGDVVRRLQRALRRTPDLSFGVDGIFGPQLEAAVRLFHEDTGLAVDGIVGPQTWNALPDGGPMPVLRVESSGAVVPSLQTLLTNGAIGGWGTTPKGSTASSGPIQRLRLRPFKPGWRVRGRARRRPDLGGLIARSERNLGKCSWPKFRHRLRLQAATSAGFPTVLSGAFAELAPCGRR